MTFYNAQNVVYGLAFINSILAALSTRPAGALVASGKLRLTTDPSFNPIPGMAIADLTPDEANYSGYTAGGNAVTLTAAVDLSGTCQGVLFTSLFEATTASPFVSNTVTGWWIDDGVNVIAAERFANNQVANFGVPGNFLNLTAILPQQLGQATV